jgi:hypothetical protein
MIRLKIQNQYNMKSTKNDKINSGENPADRHIDVPAEANRDKHINFTALDNNDPDPADEPATGKLAPDKQKMKTGKDQKMMKRENNQWGFI